MPVKQNLIQSKKIDKMYANTIPREERKKKIRKALMIGGCAVLFSVSGGVGLIGLEYNLKSEPNKQDTFLMKKLNALEAFTKPDSEIFVKQLAENSFIVKRNKYESQRHIEVEQPTLRDVLNVDFAFAVQPRDILPEKKQVIEDLVMRIQNESNSEYKDIINFDDKRRIKQEHRDTIMSYKYGKLFGK